MFRQLFCLLLITPNVFSGYLPVDTEYDGGLTATEILCFISESCCGNPLIPDEDCDPLNDKAVGTSAFDTAYGNGLATSSMLLGTITATKPKNNQPYQELCLGEPCQKCRDDNQVDAGKTDVDSLTGGYTPDCGGLPDDEIAANIFAQNTINTGGCDMSDTSGGEQQATLTTRSDCFNIAAMINANFELASWNDYHQQCSASNCHKCYWHDLNNDPLGMSVIGSISFDWFAGNNNALVDGGYKECLIINSEILDDRQDGVFGKDGLDVSTNVRDLLQGNASKYLSFPPTTSPTFAPTDAPTEAPTEAPTTTPTNTPTEAPTTETSLCLAGNGGHPHATGLLSNGDQCGGGVCDPCPDGAMCVAHTDCENNIINGGRCSTGKVCISCVDGELNNGETCIDGGGDICRDQFRCAASRHCKVDGDCIKSTSDNYVLNNVSGPSHQDWYGICDLSQTTGFTNPDALFLADHDYNIVALPANHGWCASNRDEVLQSAEETDIDCGNPSDATGLNNNYDCDAGLSCDADVDCNTLNRAHGHCETTPTPSITVQPTASGYCSSCDDGINNNGETCNDGGGFCRTEHNKRCTTLYVGFVGGCLLDDDCELDISDNEGGAFNAEADDAWCGDENFCKSCFDTNKDSAETDTDCGGVCVTKYGKTCNTGETCVDDTDCTSAICDSETLLCVTCEDGVKNGKETDVDCGGDDCGACPPNDDCLDDGDCATSGDVNGVSTSFSGLTCFNYGNSDLRCKACNDGIRNGDETGVDCGGNLCTAKCGGGEGCNTNNDCIDNCDLLNGHASGLPGICKECTGDPQCPGYAVNAEGEIEIGSGFCQNFACAIMTAAPTHAPTAAPTNQANTITFDATFDAAQHNAPAFKNFIAETIALTLDITTGEIEILEVRNGSIVVDYYVNSVEVTQTDVVNNGAKILEDIRKKVDNTGLFTELSTAAFTHKTANIAGTAHNAGIDEHTVSPTETPTNAPTRTMHLPDQWTFFDLETTNKGCTQANSVTTTSTPHFTNGDTSRPYDITYADGDHWDVTAGNENYHGSLGQYTFNVNIKRHIVNPDTSSGVVPHSGWVFFSDSVSKRKFSDACEFDIIPHDNVGTSQKSDARIGIKAHSLAHHFSVQNTDIFDGNSVKTVPGVPYTLRADCGTTSDPLELVTGDNHPGELAQKHTFAIHYVQCTELEYTSMEDCKEKGFGNVIYNVWRQQNPCPSSGTCAGYNGLRSEQVQDNRAGGPYWSNVFSPTDIFPAGMEYTAQFTPWLYDFFDQTSDTWDVDQINNWIRDNYLYVASSGTACTTTADCVSAGFSETCSTGTLGGVCVKSGHAATCRIDSRPMELQYLLPSLSDSVNGVTFNTNFVYSPNLATSDPITTYIISGNVDAANQGGEIIPENLIFTSCYHSPRRDGYNPYTHEFCMLNNLYSLNRNYLYAGMPYRFYFEFVNNANAPSNVNADGLLDSIYDFEIDSIDFHLFKDLTDANSGDNAKAKMSRFHQKECGPNDNEICDVDIYNVQLNDPPEAYNAFEVYGNEILNMDDAIFKQTTCELCCFPVPCCVDSPCVLRMTLQLSICEQSDPNCTPDNRRRLRKQVDTTILNRRLFESSTFNDLQRIQGSMIEITTPSWNTQVIEVDNSQNTQDVLDKIVTCMAGTGKLIQCEAPPAVCTDIQFTVINNGATGNNTKYQMAIGQNQMIKLDVQEALDACFAESDAAPINPQPTPGPTVFEDAQNNEILWIILIAIGVVSLLSGGVMWIIFRFSRNRSAPVSATSNMERMRLVSDPEQGQFVGANKQPLRFGSLKYN